MRLSFTILFKLSFESMFDYSSFLKLIIANKTFFLFVIKNFFVSTILLIEFMLSHVINKIFIKIFFKFSAELMTCYNFFHFIFNEIQDFLKIFRNRFYVIIVYFKKWRVKLLLFLINRLHLLHAKWFNILNDNFDIENWNRLKIELIWR